MSGLSKTALWLALLTGLVCAVTLVLWQAGLDPRAPGAQVGQIQNALSPWRTPLQLLRLVLWLLVAWCWQGALARALRITDAQRPQWNALRPRVVGGLLALEALIALGRLVANNT